MVFQRKPLEKAYFIVKMTGPAVDRPASSDQWKAPQDSPFICLYNRLVVSLMSFSPMPSINRKNEFTVKCFAV